MRHNPSDKFFVPVLSTRAGHCLTFANWQEAGVSCVSFRLADLLVKPGLSLLNRLTDIREFFNWTGEIVINAMLPSPDGEGIFTIRSHFDGSLIRIDAASLFALLSRLKADKVILPRGSAGYLNRFRADFPESTQLLLHVDDWMPSMETWVGKYVVLESNLALSSLPIDELYCIVDRLDWTNLGDQPSQHLILESDQPAADGMAGRFYGRDGELNILDPSMENAHCLLDAGCCCQTCRQGFTRAGLHHLLQHTPLLAQRYLIQHNVAWCENHFHLPVEQIPL